MAWVRRGAVIFFSVIFLYLFWVAARLPVDYFDNYSSLLAAKSVVGAHGPAFQAWRHSVLPALLTAPFFALERALGGPEFVFTLTHLLSVLFFALFLWAFYRLLRIHLDRS